MIIKNVVLEGEELTTWDTLLSGEGYLCTHPHKVEFILNCHVPSKSIHYFQRFSEDYGKNAKLLTDLLNIGSFSWNSDAKRALWKPQKQ
jgi:hypothetical protein